MLETPNINTALAWPRAFPADMSKVDCETSSGQGAKQAIPALLQLYGKKMPRKAKSNSLNAAKERTHHNPHLFLSFMYSNSRAREH